MAVAPPPIDTQPAQTERLAPDNVGYGLFLLVAIPACCFPMVQLHGLRLTIGPLLYLLAAERWGLRRGLIAAFLLTMPGLLLWGPTLKPLIALGQVWFVCRMQRHRLLMAEATTLYDLMFVPIGLLAPIFLPAIAPAISMLELTQYVLAHVLMAATADVLRQNFTLARHIPFILLRPARSLEGSLRAMINFVVALLFSVALVNEVQSIHEQADSYREQIRSIVAENLAQSAFATASFDRILNLELYDQTRVHLYASNRAAGFEQRAAQRLGASCRTFVHSDRSGASIAHAMPWARICEIDEDHVRPDLLTATAFQGRTGGRFSWMSSELMVLFLSGVFALAYRVSITRSLRRAMTSGVGTIMRFGEPNLPMPSQQPFGEFDKPLRRFVALNNNFVATVEERDRLATVAAGLKRSIDLQLMSDIHFDPATGFLCFHEVRIAKGPLDHRVKIHPADHPYFTAVDGSDEAVVEFRVAGTESMETFLVTLRRAVGILAWESGIGIRLRQPQRLRELMQRQARLVDLGSMAAAITHEMKQPMFTIAMAAESIRIILEKRGHAEDDEPLDRCVTRISTQVDRARDIIRRISRYGHLEALDPGGSDAAAALESARSFLQPLLEERNITVTMEIPPEVYWVNVSRIALEQVMVNAMQNAADAVSSARDAGFDAGHLTLGLSRTAERIDITIADDGIGLQPGVGDSAFEAFFTTKTVENGTGLGLFISRQIIIDAGGTVALLPNDRRGATLLVSLPVGLKTLLKGES
jgi:signal transduction histidine kinase